MAQCFAMCAVRPTCGTSRFAWDTKTCLLLDESDMREAHPNTDAKALTRVGMQPGWVILNPI